MSQQMPEVAASRLPMPVAVALDTAWHTTPVTPLPLDLIVVAGRRRSRHARQVLAVAALGVAASVVAAVSFGASTQEGTEVVRDPAQLQSDTSPAPLPSDVTGRMLVQDRAYQPGEMLEIRWPNGDLRGFGYSFDRWDGTAWEPTFFLRSAPEGVRGGANPDWWAVGEGGSWEDLGLAGPGPDVAVVPEVAPSGTYRLCTANSQTQSCALVEVADSAS